MENQQQSEKVRLTKFTLEYVTKVVFNVYLKYIKDKYIYNVKYDNQCKVKKLENDNWVSNNTAFLGNKIFFNPKNYFVDTKFDGMYDTQSIETITYEHPIKHDNNYFTGICEYDFYNFNVNFKKFDPDMEINFITLDSCRKELKRLTVKPIDIINLANRSFDSLHNQNICLWTEIKEHFEYLNTYKVYKIVIYIDDNNKINLYNPTLDKLFEKSLEIFRNYKYMYMLHNMYESDDEQQQNIIQETNDVINMYTNLKKILNNI